MRPSKLAKISPMKMTDSGRMSFESGKYFFPFRLSLSFAIRATKTGIKPKKVAAKATPAYCTAEKRHQG